MFSRRRRWVEYAALILAAHIGCKGSDAVAPLVPSIAGAVTPISVTGTVGLAVSQAPSVKVTTSSGVPVPDVAVTFAIVAGGGSLTGANATTDDAGVATVGSWTLGTVAGPNVLSAKVSSLPTVTFGATAAPGPVSKLSLATVPSLTVPSRAVLPIQPVLQVQDQFGNSVPQAGTQVTASVAANSATLSGTLTALTDAGGKASFTDLKLSGAIGPKSIAFAASATPTITSPVTLTAGPAATLTLMAGDAQTAAAGTPVAVKPSVRITDADNNPVSGLTVVFAVVSGGGVLTGATQVTDSAGVATVGGWTLGPTAGANSLTASAAVLAGVSVPVSADGIAGAAAKIGLVTPPGSAVQNRIAFAAQPVLQLKDALGNSVEQAGVTVTATIAAGGGALGGTTSVATSSAGTASFTDLSIAGTIGARKLRFAVTGLLSDSALLQLSAGVAASMSIVTGANQSASAGTAVATPPTVVVKDADGNVVSGASVSFAIASGSGSVVGAASTSDSLGVAKVGTWVLGPIPGPNSLVATVAGLNESQAVFTAVADPSFRTDTTSVDSTALSGAGASLTLPTGTVATVVSSSTAAAAVLKLSEVAGAAPTAGNDTTRHFIAEIAGGNVGDSAVIQLSVAIGNGPPVGMRQWAFVRGASDPPGVGTWVAPTSAPSSPQVASPNAVSGPGFQSVGGAPSAFSASPGVVARSLFLLPLQRLVSEIFLIQLPEADPPDCEDYRQFGPHPLTPDRANPDFTVVLIHGWQPSLICPGANLPGADYLANFHPDTGWRQMALAIREAYPNANVEVVRYSTTAPPSAAALYVNNMLTQRNATGNTGPVVLVGHSMGGLVARYAAEFDHGTSKIVRIVTLGTPHLGSPVADFVSNFVFVPSQGLASLGSNVVNNQIPLPSEVPLFAARGSIPCSVNLSGWLRYAQAKLCEVLSETDGAVPTPSAVPESVDGSFASEGKNHLQLTGDAGIISQTIEWLSPPFGPTIILTPASLTLSAVAGSGAVTSTIDVKGIGPRTLSGLTVGTIDFGPEANGWLSASLAGTSDPATLSLVTTPGVLEPGTYTATVRIVSSMVGVTNTPKAYSVTLNITPVEAAPSIALSATSKVFAASTGGSNPPSQTVEITNSGGGTLAGLSASVTYPNGQPSGWISTSLSSTSTPSTLTLTPSVGALVAGAYVATVSLSSSSVGVTNSPQTVAITLNITAAPTVVHVGPGREHTCELMSSGDVYCVGDGHYGQLGNGSTAEQSALVAVIGGQKFDRLSVSAENACGLTNSGAAYCWGYNEFGPLGDGSTTNRSSPVAVLGGHAFASISAGEHHSCAVTSAGAAYCWGLNTWGQLGDGSTSNRTAPVAVAGGLAFASVTVGTSHTCGVTTGGVAYCWGSNSVGRLGDGTTTNRAVPTSVSGGLLFSSIAAGGLHTCGITTLGATAYCWGYNGQGALGDGSTANRSGPVAVVGALSFLSIDVGAFHSCARTPTSEAFCWGRNTEGQLGNGTTTDTVIPVQVVGGHIAASIRAGAYSNCLVASGAVAYCWGSNAYGHLGDGTTIARSSPIAFPIP
jgi:alpha-tubulin suppressor-like RCC1 family protein/pimeloyl-ACP methyl ester carboxylesterase